MKDKINWTNVGIYVLLYAPLWFVAFRLSQHWHLGYIGREALIFLAAFIAAFCMVLIGRPIIEPRSGDKPK